MSWVLSRLLLKEAFPYTLSASCSENDNPKVLIQQKTTSNMDKPSSTSAFLNATIAADPTANTRARQDPSCTQTVEVPIWYGPDYNTCSMQPTMAPCSVSFPRESCHTSRPAPTIPSPALSGTTKLWIVIGVTILLTILIPVVVLWARWKLRAPRRGGKRSISVQLEKNEAKKSTAPASSGPKRERNLLCRLLGRNQRNPAHAAGNQKSHTPRSIDTQAHCPRMQILVPST